MCTWWRNRRRTGSSVALRIATLEARSLFTPSSWMTWNKQANYFCPVGTLVLIQQTSEVTPKRKPFLHSYILTRTVSSVLNQNSSAIGEEMGTEVHTVSLYFWHCNMWHRLLYFVNICFSYNRKNSKFYNFPFSVFQ